VAGLSPLPDVPTAPFTGAVSFLATGSGQ